MSSAVTDSSQNPHDHGHDDHGDGAVHAHVSSPLFMVGIFLALIFLTVVTVAVSYVDLGSANTVVAVLVATLKASLVASFFMHLRWDKPFHAIIFISSFFFLGLLLMFSTDDLSTRGKVDVNNGTHVLERNGQTAPGGLQVPAAPSGTPAAGEHGAAEHGAAEHH